VSFKAPVKNFDISSHLHLLDNRIGVNTSNWEPIVQQETDDKSLKILFWLTLNCSKMPSVSLVYPSLGDTGLRKQRYCKYRDCAKVGVLNDEKHSKRNHVKKRFSRYKTWQWRSVYGHFGRLRVMKSPSRCWMRLVEEDEDWLEPNVVNKDNNNEDKSWQMLQGDDETTLEMDNFKSGKERRKSWVLRKLAKFGKQKRKCCKDSLVPDSPKLKRRRTSFIVPPVSYVSILNLRGFVAEGCRQAVGYVRRLGSLFLRSGYERLTQVDD
jgi:hypothetical protein